MGKKVRFAVITCLQCGHANHVPVDPAFQVSTPLRCRRCRIMIAQPEKH